MSIHSTRAGKRGGVLITEQQIDLDAAIDHAVVARLLGVSRVTVWRMVRAGRLPEPFYARERLPRWVMREILAAREALRMSPQEAKAASRANKLAGLTQSTAADHRNEEEEAQPRTTAVA